MAFHPKFDLLAVGSRHVLNFTYPPEAKYVKVADTDPIRCLQYSHDGYLLATGGDRHVTIFDGITGTIKKKWQLPCIVYDVTFTADKRYLITANGNGTVYVFRVPEEVLTETNPERRVAKWVLSVGGRVWIRPQGEKQHIPIRHIDKLPRVPFQLWWIYLNGAEHKLNDETIEILRDAVHVQHLSLARTKITDQGMQRLTKLAWARNLRSLHLLDCPITDACMPTIATFVDLRELSINAASDNGLQHVQKLRALKKLDMTGADITNRGFQNLDGLDLEFLQITGCTKITDGAVAHIAKMGSLSFLHVEYTQIGDGHLHLLRRLNNLGQLFVGGTKITEHGLKTLTPLKSLRDLALDFLPITNKGLADIAKHEKLHSLSLMRTKIDDNGLPTLAMLHKLSKLRLNGTNISDAGLQTLKNFKNLRQLDLFKTVVTAEGVAMLRRALPDCQITWKANQTDAKQP